MPLAALDPLTRVDPLRLLRYVARRLDRLRVQNRRSGLRRTARRPADLAAQRIMDRLGDTFLLPQGKVAMHGLVRRVIVR